MKKPFLTLSEAAKYLDLKPKTLYQYIHQGKLKPLKPNGGKVYFRKEDLDSFILDSK